MSEQGTKDIFEEILENAPAIRNQQNIKIIERIENLSDKQFDYLIQLIQQHPEAFQKV